MRAYGMIVCLHICLFACLCAYIYVFVRVRMFVCVRACTYMSLYGYICNICLYELQKGETALHLACRKRKLEVAKWLAEQMSSEAAVALNQVMLAAEWLSS